MTKPTTKSLRFWQWETLLVTMGGCALYYDTHMSASCGAACGLL